MDQKERVISVDSAGPRLSIGLQWMILASLIYGVRQLTILEKNVDVIGQSSDDDRQKLEQVRSDVSDVQIDLNSLRVEIAELKRLTAIATSGPR